MKILFYLNERDYSIQDSLFFNRFMKFQVVCRLCLRKNVLLSFILIGCMNSLRSQVNSNVKERESKVSSISNTKDTTSLNFNDKIATIKDKLNQTTKGLKNNFPDSTSRISVLNPLTTIKNVKFGIRATDGYIGYQFGYRSNPDTPFAEKNIYQHNVQARLNLMVANILPFTISFFGRRTNSAIFNDINDVQFIYNSGVFSQSIQNTLRDQLLAMAPSLKDSLTGRLLALKRVKFDELEKWLNSTEVIEKRIEANEILKVPRVTYDPYSSQEANQKREDSLKKTATAFIELYDKTADLYYKVNNEIDSLSQVYQKSLNTMRRFQDMIKTQGIDITSRKWSNLLEEFGVKDIKVPQKYKWLLGVKRFSIGRNSVDMSELTAKNISINGLNFEYNSWYYLAITAGIINYGFRDFSSNHFRNTPQYLIMGRIGLGQIRGNHIIFSLYEGRKNLFMYRSGINGRTTMHIMGYSIETRYQLNRTTFVTAEFAESSSPDFRNNPGQSPNKLASSNSTNKSYALRMNTSIPKIKLNLEGFYKFAGANFQSFNGFQTNASQKVWYLKADQSLFNRQLRLALSVRSTDFSNPLIVQQYNSNTIFKSFMATFRRKKWPLLTIGYLPMTQLSKIGSQFIENRFQTFNASYHHIYRIKKSRAATTFVFNRFYNTQMDSGFIYYNANNWFVSQYLYFKSFSIGTTTSLIRNLSYRLLIIEQNIQWNLTKLGTLGFGAKINRFNESIQKIGGFCNGTFRVGKADLLTFSVEKGYMPAFSGGLISNDFYSIQFMKSFSFSQH